MRQIARVASTVAALAGCAGPASAVVLGTLDTFQDATTQGWGSGAANPTPPATVLGGGPAGAADNYLSITANGLSGPGSRLVGINATQWAGNYLSAGVDSIQLDLRNFGSTELNLRLALFGSSGVAVTTVGVVLPAGSGWTAASFSLNPALLTGNGLAVLGDVIDLRLFHGTTAEFPGAAIAAALGVDNIRAVPEPAPAALLAAGLAALAWRRQRAAAVRFNTRRQTP